MIERMNIPLLNEIESIYDPPPGAIRRKKRIGKSMAYYLTIKEENL